MWRYLVGAAAALALAAAGLFLFQPSAANQLVVPAAPPQPAPVETEPLPERVPEATPKTREQKRFDRYDKDCDDGITRAEYLASRRKAFARLDGDRDGRLSFDEWAVKTTTKFATADADGSGGLNRTEFATTAMKRKAPQRQRCVCPAEE